MGVREQAFVGLRDPYFRLGMNMSDTETQQSNAAIGLYAAAPAAGLVTTHFGGDATAYSVAVQADGKILASGLVRDGNGYNTGFALARYNADGSLDTSFGNNTPPSAAPPPRFPQARKTPLISLRPATSSKASATPTAMAWP